MGGGGKGGSSQQTQPTSQTVTQTNLPEYARPYFEDLLTKTQSATAEPYLPYSGQRNAQFGADQQQAFQSVRDIAGQGTPQGIMAAQSALGGLSNYQANYDPSTTTTGTFDAAAAQRYMDPYLQQVLRTQSNEAAHMFNTGQAQRDAGAVRAGAFGGSRSAIADETARSEMQRNLMATQAGLLSQGYAQAGNLFNADQSRALQAQQATEQSRQFGANLGLQGAGLATQAAGSLANVSNMGRAADVQAATMLQQQGAQQQQLEQQGLDTAYADFVNQRDYPKQQLNFYSGILRGVPVTAQSEVLQYQQQPNQLSQMLGLGIGGLGLAKGLGG